MTKKKVKQNNIKTNNIVNSMQSMWYSYLWNSLGDCWKLVINLNTFYEVQTYNTEAQAFKQKIVNWIWKNWMYIVDKNNQVIDKKEILEKINRVFNWWNFNFFKDKYFTQNFCSWEIYMYPATNVLWEVQCQILDSRMMKKDIDDMWNITEYQLKSAKWIIHITTDKIYNSIIKYNPNNPYYWASIYESIVYDALADKETSKKNYYFFENNATPNVIYMLNPELTNKDQIKLTEESIKNNHKGTEKSNNFMLSNAIVDAKILDISYKDLDLLNLREFVIKKMWIVFQIDPRVIGFITDVWAYNAIKEIRKEAKDTIQALANKLESDMNTFYKTFVDTRFEYQIKLDSESFEDRNTIEENQRKDVILWLQTIKMVWEERWYDINLLPEEANKPIIWNNIQLLESISQNPTQNII